MKVCGLTSSTGPAAHVARAISALYFGSLRHEAPSDAASASTAR